MTIYEFFNYLAFSREITKKEAEAKNKNQRVY